MSLANTPENVVLVRYMLSGVAEAIDLDGIDLNDLRTAVTEACNNVVLHAYESNEGPLEIEVYLAPQVLRVLVRDHGIGIPGEPKSPEASATEIGLHVIKTLTHKVEFKDGVDGGTEVWMEFAIPEARSLERPQEDGLRIPALHLPLAPTTTTIRIAPIGLARMILPRLVIALAARAHFSTDRISDVQLLADALVTQAQEAVSGEELNIEVTVEPRDLELRIAPLDVGHAQLMIGESELGGLSRVIEKLADRHDIATAGHYEMLTLGLSDPR